MPSSFLGIRDWRLSTNSFGLDQNCYYCTIAALLNTDVDTLVSRTETMQQDCANADEISALFSSAGTTVQYQVFGSEAAAANFVTRFPNQSALAIGYTRGNGSGHMVVVVRDSGAPLGVGFIDYQMRPPGIYNSLAHEAGVISYTVFYMP
jgi:hypothetical protein